MSVLKAYKRRRDVVEQSYPIFFSLISPFAYLGHEKLLEIAKKHNKTLLYRPIMLMEVWKMSGAVPLPQRPLARQNYRLIELQRWRAARGVPLNLHPRYFPTNPALADRTVIALTQASHNPHKFMTHIFRAVWVNDLDTAEEAVITNCLNNTGYDAATIIQNAKTDSVLDEDKQNTEAGQQLQIISSPTYVYQNEPFWGQDRLELLDDTLTRQRAPFHT